MNSPSARKKRLDIVGASGMVGGYALRYALGHPAIAGVTSIGRRKLDIEHPKLNEIVHPEFADCSALAQALTGQDAAVFCLGAYTGAVSNQALHTITVDYTVEFSRVLHLSSPAALFSYLSGSGADPTGRSRMAFARYKGKAERSLLASGFPHVYIFRPAYIYPVEPRKEPTTTYRMMRWIYPAFRLFFPNQAIRADDLAQVMVNVVVAGEASGPVFENGEIRAMAKSYRASSSVQGKGSTYDVEPVFWLAQQLAGGPKNG